MQFVSSRTPQPIKARLGSRQTAAAGKPLNHVSEAATSATPKDPQAATLVDPTSTSASISPQARSKVAVRKETLPGNSYLIALMVSTLAAQVALYLVKNGGPSATIAQGTTEVAYTDPLELLMLPTFTVAIIVHLLSAMVGLCFAALSRPRSVISPIIWGIVVSFLVWGAVNCDLLPKLWGGDYGFDLPLPAEWRWYAGVPCLTYGLILGFGYPLLGLTLGRLHVVFRFAAFLAVLALVWSTLPTEVTPAQALDVDVGKGEFELITLTNIDRTSNGLPAVESYGPVMTIARERSEDMLDRNYFSHEIPPGNHTFVDLLNRDRVPYLEAAENIESNAEPGYNSVQFAAKHYMSSPKHRAAILNPRFTHLGTGMARGDDRFVFTEIFIKKPSISASYAPGDNNSAIGLAILPSSGGPKVGKEGTKTFSLSVGVQWAAWLWDRLGLGVETDRSEALDPRAKGRSGPNNPGLEVENDNATGSRPDRSIANRRPQRPGLIEETTSRVIRLDLGLR